MIHALINQGNGYYLKVKETENEIIAILFSRNFFQPFSKSTNQNSFGVDVQLKSSVKIFFMCPFHSSERGSHNALE